MYPAGESRDRGAGHRRVGKEAAEPMKMPFRRPNRAEAVGIGVSSHLGQQPVLVPGAAFVHRGKEHDSEFYELSPLLRRDDFVRSSASQLLFPVERSEERTNRSSA